jgi:hypothetical protein
MFINFLFKKNALFGKKERSGYCLSVSNSGNSGKGKNRASFDSFLVTTRPSRH